MSDCRSCGGAPPRVSGQIRDTIQPSSSLPLSANAEMFKVLTAGGVLLERQFNSKPRAQQFADRIGGTVTQVA